MNLKNLGEYLWYITAFLDSDSDPLEKNARKKLEEIAKNLMSGTPVGNIEVLCQDEGCPHHGTPHVCNPIGNYENTMVVSSAWSPILEEIHRRADNQDGLNSDFTVTIQSEEYRNVCEAEENLR